MGAGNVRKGIVQAAWNRKANAMFIEEGTLISLIVGLATWSWIWFGATILFVSVVLMIPVLNKIFSFVMSVIWGLLAGGVMGYFISVEAGWVCGLLTFLVSIGYHLAAIEYAKDLSDPHDRNF